MNIIIVVHSVSGNTYCLGRRIAEKLRALGQNPLFCRVPDEDAGDLAFLFPNISAMLPLVKELPEASPEMLLEQDLIFLGSPTYFGNMSGEMKQFLDGTGSYWPEAKLRGKKLFPFTTASNPEGGAHLCLQALSTYGLHMNMHPLSVPNNLELPVPMPAYGFTAYSGAQADKLPDEKTLQSLDMVVEDLMRN